MALIQADTLLEFVVAVFHAVGVSEDDARTAADVLIWANLHGIDTHGVRNLRNMYIDPLLAEKIKPRAINKVMFESSISARIDGDGGLGLVGATKAMDFAIEKARETGIGLVSMRNSFHLGAAGYFAMRAVPRDMIGLSMSGNFYAEGAERGVRPPFGSQPLLSTNPLSFAFPTDKESPFLLDMATSVVPYNRVEMYQEENRSVPLGWGLDANGQATTNPAELRHLLPLGGSRELGGHKGFGLGLVVEILGAILSGGWQAAGDVYPVNEYQTYKQHNAAHFLGAIRLDMFRPANEFKRDMDALIRAIHAAPPDADHERVIYPGEIEAKTKKYRIAAGIPLSKAVASDLREISEQFDIPLDIEAV